MKLRQARKILCDVDGPKRRGGVFFRASVRVASTGDIRPNRKLRAFWQEKTAQFERAAANERGRE